MTPEEVRAHFSTAAGDYQFARWLRPIVPVVFGVDDATLPVIKGAIEAVARLAKHEIAETDPDMGANLMVFFVADWSELSDVPDLAHLVPELAALVPKLQEQDADQYRMFRFENDGAIRAAFVFLRLSDAMAAVPAQSLALAQAVRIILLWGTSAFADVSPLGRVSGTVDDVMRPEIAALIRAAYDPVLPGASRDPDHAMRLFARYTQKIAEQGR